MWYKELSIYLVALLMCATVKPTSIAPIHKYLVSLMCTLIHPVFNAFIHRSTHERKYVEYSTTVNSTLDRATFSRMIFQDISPCGFLSVNSTRSVDFLFLPQAEPDILSQQQMCDIFLPILRYCRVRGEYWVSS